MIKKTSVNNVIEKFFLFMIFISIYLAHFFPGYKSVAGVDVSADSIIKVIFYFVSAVVCVFFAKTWIKKFLKIENLFLLMLILLMCISSLWSPPLIYSLRASFTFTCTVILFYAASSLIEDRKIVTTLMLSASSISFLSLCAYLVLPEYARGKDWTGDVQIVGTRLSGIVGNANSMGFIAASGIFLCYLSVVYYRYKTNFLTIFLLLANVFALFLSESRGAVLSLAVACSFIYFSRLSIFKLSLFLFLVGFSILLYFYITSYEAQSLFTRAGSDDVTSERSNIWRVVWQLIQEKPWFGWGAGSGPIVLPLYRGLIGHAPVHAHNLYLNLLFSLGYSGFFLFLTVLFIKISKSIYPLNVPVLSLIIITQVHGIIEPSVLQGLANMDTILFAVAMCLSGGFHGQFLNKEKCSGVLEADLEKDTTSKVLLPFFP